MRRCASWRCIANASTAAPRSEKEAELARKIDDIERRLRLVGLRAERAEFYRIARGRQLSDEIARKLVREVDLLESRFSTT